MKHFSSSIFLLFAFAYLISAATVPVVVKAQKQIQPNVTQTNEGAVPATPKASISQIVELSQDQVQDRPVVDRALLLDSIFNIPISTLRSINELVRNFSLNLQNIGARFTSNNNNNKNSPIVEAVSEVESLEI